MTVKTVESAETHSRILEPLKRGGDSCIDTQIGTLVISRESIDNPQSLDYRFSLKQTGIESIEMGSATVVFFGIKSLQDTREKETLIRAGLKGEDKIATLVTFFPFSQVDYRDSIRTDGSKEGKQLKRRGIGSVLLTQIEKDVEQEGAMAMILVSGTFEAASFFKKNGFQAGFGMPIGMPLYVKKFK